MDFDKILEEIKEELEISDLTYDKKLNRCINQVIEKIKAYCNIKEIPKEPIDILYTIVDMTIKFFLAKNPSFATSTESTGTNDSNVSSIKIGDTEVNFSDSSNAYTHTKTSDTAILESILQEHLSELHQLRRLPW